MAEIVGILLYAAVTGALDYRRGRGQSKAFAFVMGVWLMWWSTVFWGAAGWFPAAFAVLFAIGSVPGWGHPIGRALGGENHVSPEDWQFHRILVDSIPLALAVRGLMWALPTCLLAYWEPRVLYGMFIIPLAFTAAPYIAKRVFEPSLERWRKMEAIRGVLIGLGYGVTLVYG